MSEGALFGSCVQLITVPLGVHRLAYTASFIRNVQITGDKVTGDVYVAGMDEGGGGFPHNDTNKIFRSTDGGATWTNTYTGLLSRTGRNCCRLLRPNVFGWRWLLATRGLG